MGVNLCDLELENNLNKTPRAQTKKDTLEFIKMKNFSILKNSRKWKESPQNGGKYFQIIYTIRELYSINKNDYNSKIKTKNVQSMWVYISPKNIHK